MRVILLGLMGLVAVACSPIQADEDSESGRLNVTGTGKTLLAPDMAILDLAVVSEAKTAREALTDNSASMTKVLASLQEEGIAERDIQTSGFAIHPRYNNRRNNQHPQTPEIMGYSVRNSLTVRIRDLKRVGEILDTSVSLGINQGGNIRFANDDPSAALQQARTAAVHDARRKAQTLADAAGVELGRLIAMSENTGVAAPMPRAREMSMMSSVAVPVMGGENTYQVNVSVTYELPE